MGAKLERIVHSPRSTFSVPRVALVGASVLAAGLVVLVVGIGVMLGHERPRAVDQRLGGAMSYEASCLREREQLFYWLADKRRSIEDISPRFATHRLVCQVDAELSRLYHERLFVEGECDRASALPCELEDESREATLATVRNEVFDCNAGSSEEGRVQVDVEVNPDGWVMTAVHTTAPSEALGLCVARAVGLVNYGKTQLGGSFTYTIDF